MQIALFGVEQWMNEYETRCRHNLAETCCDSITVEELLQLSGQSPEHLHELLDMKLTYGAIEDPIVCARPSLPCTSTRPARTRWSPTVPSGRISSCTWPWSSRATMSYRSCRAISNTRRSPSRLARRSPAPCARRRLAARCRRARWRNHARDEGRLAHQPKQPDGSISMVDAADDRRCV